MRLKGNWARYLDKDGDAIPYRTVPGNRHPASAYFTRGTGHDEHAQYTEDAGVWHHMMDRLKHKYETARNHVPRASFIFSRMPSAGIIAFGSTEAAILEAQHQLSTEHDLKTDFMRVRALPFTDDVKDFVAEHDQILCGRNEPRRADGAAAQDRISGAVRRLQGP